MTVSVFIVGQSQVGKTAVANHLAEITDSKEYHETVGVRILETTKSVKNIQVELWDVSGNPKFYSLLSGISKDCQGLIYVSNGSDSRTLESIFSHLSPSQVLILQSGSVLNVENWRNSTVIRDFSLTDSSMAKVKTEFEKFLIQLNTIQQEKKESEESSIVGL